APVGGVAGVAGCEVAASGSVEVVGGGLGGVVVLFLISRPHPAARAHATGRAAAKLDFMIPLIVTYDALLYPCRSRASIPLYRRHLRTRAILIPTASGASSISSLTRAPTASRRSA